MHSYSYLLWYYFVSNTAFFLGKFDGDLMVTEECWQLTVPTWLSK